MVKNRRFEEEHSGFGIRHVQVVLLFCALTVGFGMRVNLSVGIVAMAEFPVRTQAKTNQMSRFSKPFFYYNILGIPVVGVYKIPGVKQLFWGYVVTQLPAGLLARRFGGKVTILSGLSLCSVLTLLTPLCTRLGGWRVLCAIRLLEGICQGFLFPSCHTVISAWAPPKERAFMGNFVYAGNQFGTIVMLATSGVLVTMGGWPCIYYASGGIGCLWAVFYYVWGASSPAESKGISTEERELIEMGQAEERTGPVDDTQKQRTPWLSFISSPAVLAVITVQSAYAYGFYTLLTQIPSYMKNVLDKDIKANAMLSSLPYIAMLLLSGFFAWSSKTMQNKKSISLSFNRKFFNSIGTFGPMLLLIALGYVRKEQDTLAVVLLILTVGISSAAHVGFLINHIDLSPNFAGIIMGICNCIANFMSLAAPLVVGVIVTDTKDVHQWRLVFFVSAAVYFVGNLTFLIFGRTNVQSWNDPPAKISRNSTGELESQKE